MHRKSKTRKKTQDGKTKNPAVVTGNYPVPPVLFISSRWGVCLLKKIKKIKIRIKVDGKI